MLPQTKRPKCRALGVRAAGEVFCSQKGRRERCSGNGCAPPSQVRHVEFQETQGQRELLVMSEALGYNTH